MSDMQKLNGNAVESRGNAVESSGMPWNAVECRRGSGWGFVPGPFLAHRKGGSGAPYVWVTLSVPLDLGRPWGVRWGGSVPAPSWPTVRGQRLT